MTDVKENWRWEFMGFDFYEIPENQDEWLPCPECGEKPRVWVFDHSRSAHCVCGVDRYHHKHTVKATPIAYYIETTGGFTGYDSDELRKNWNNYVKNLELITGGIR